MRPPIVPEQLVSCFKFIEIQGHLADGMRYRSELYRHVATLEITQKQQAYSLALALGQYGRNAVVTRSQINHRVWVKLGYNANLESPLPGSTQRIANGH